MPGLNNIDASRNNTVSIIIPVYNVESFVETCIRSIMNQTYDDIECIIVDDKGTDKSIEICESVISEYRGDKQFKIIHHNENLGLSEARNTGIRDSTGKWIYFLDSDDSLDINAISHLVSLFHQYPDASVAIGQFVCPQNPEKYKFPFCSSTDYIAGKGIGEYLLFTEKIPINACDKLILRELVIEHNLWFVPRLIHEDEMWIYQAARFFNKIAFASNNTYIRNIDQNPNSIMSTVTMERTRNNWNIILNNILNDKAHYHQERALLKYLKNLLAYYKFVSDDGTTYKIFQQFMSGLKIYGNHKLIKLLKLYEKWPLSIGRSQLRRVLLHMIDIRLNG